MNKFKLILIIAIFPICAGIYSAETFPLEIDADSSDCGTDLENCTLIGNVLIRQGDARVSTDKLFSRSETEWELSGNITIEKTGITIEAQKASIILKQRQLESFSLVGEPVNFRYLVDNSSQAAGKANNISFNLNSRMIILEGAAQLLESGNELNGEHIEYDIDAERLKANNQGQGDGRVHLIFEPPGKAVPQSENGDETTQNQESESQE